jgi:hypothetical protein
MNTNPLSSYEYPLMYFGNLVIARSGLQVCVAISEPMAKKICQTLNNEEEARIAEQIKKPEPRFLRMLENLIPPRKEREN